MSLRDALRSLFEPPAGQPSEPVASAPKRIGLALGGGGVRGAAHVGALSVLERAGVEFDVVAGTSIGAIVGACVAAGVPMDVLRQRFLSARWIDLARPALGSRLSMFDANPLGDVFSRTVHAETFAELRIPFVAVASDILTASTVAIDSGPLREAVLASAAIPAVFLPVRRGKQLLVDGGLTENLPVSQVRALGADVVIAIDIVPRPDASYEPKDAVDMVMLTITGVDWLREAGREQADVLIAPKLARYSLMDLSHVQEMYDAGAEAAEAVLDDVLAAVGNRSAAAPEGR